MVALPSIDIQYLNLAQSEAQDEMSSFCTSKPKLKLSEVDFGSSNTPIVILSNISGSTLRLVIPQSLERPVFDIIHLLSHPSARFSVKLITKKICLEWDE
uniref:Meprin A subunit betalike [Takifugu rubripes] n=1 Tax=Lepeophtheirus salmonis TaxID=72036 RepID=A0A0K2TB78_LEPSM